MTDQIISPLFMVAETPLHAGSGDSLGLVDLPIQRERHTGFPKIESSSPKGALREAMETWVNSSLKNALREAMETSVNSHKFKNWGDADVKIHRIFGFDDGSLSKEDKATLQKRFETTDTNGTPDKGSDFSGCLKMTDARLLLFPVKSIKGVFAWVTCPRVLAQLAQDLRMHDPDFAFKDMPPVFRENQCYVLQKGGKLEHEGHVVLEEYTFKVAEAAADIKTNDDQPLIDWLSACLPFDPWWKGHLNEAVVLLSDTDFADFVRLSTEVITRIKIDNETGAVEQGALFSEEYLPADSVLYTMLIAEEEFSRRKRDEKMTKEAVMTFVHDHLPEVFQLGGNASIGKGILKRSKIRTITYNDQPATEHEQHA